MSASQEAESKFAHLLQPIRELAANWDIDIANELEDYLEVLENITFSFEGEDGPSLNFAEAALVIQGSACVYSRKVEYLHTLVQNSIQLIAEKRKRKERSSQEDVADEHEDIEHFLNLDDTLEEGAGIDLDETNVGSIAPPVRPPNILLALECSGQPAGDNDTGHYRVASCGVHASGAVLLEPRSGDHLDMFLRPLASHSAAANPWAGLGSAAVDAPQPPGNEGPNAPEDALRSRLADGAGELPDGPSPGPGGHADTGMDHAAGGNDDSDDDGPPPAAAMVGHGCRGDPGTERPEAGRDDREEDEYDPYAPLDPHDPGGLPVRPLKRGWRPAKRRPVPPQGADEHEDANVLSLHALLLHIASSKGGLFFPEFQYALPVKRAPARGERGPRGRAAIAGMACTLDAGVQAAEAAMAEDELEDGVPDSHPAGLSSDDEPDNPGEAGYASDDNGHEPLFVSSGLDASAGGGGGEEPSYEDLCRAHVEAAMRVAAAAEVSSDLAQRVGGWRAKVGPALAEQDAHGEFDIHRVGDTIIGKLKALALTETQPGRPETEPDIAFADVVTALPKWQVSRVFSALLQLVNNSNVTLLRGPEPGTAFRLRLDSLVRPHEKFKDFRAPSFLKLKDVNAMGGRFDNQNDAGNAQPDAAVAGAGSPVLKGLPAGSGGASPRPMKHKKGRRQ